MRPADRDRWLALGLLVAALALLWLLVLRPLFLRPLSEVQATIDQLRERDGRLLGVLAERGKVQQGLAELQAQGGLDGFLAEPGAELAAAGLIQRLERVVTEASVGGRGCAIVNRTPLGDEAQAGRYRRVTVQVRLRCGNAETVAVIHELESERPFLFLDAVSITAQRFFAIPGNAQPQEGGLDVSFNLYGYLRPGSVGDAR